MRLIRKKSQFILATKRNFLPAPENAAKLLSEQTIENIETWEHKFGDKYSIVGILSTNRHKINSNFILVEAIL